jgi:hypothetical protein
MLHLLFELLNHLHERPFQLVKGINKAKRSYRPLSKDLNLSKKHVVFFLGGGACQKGLLYEKAWPDVACQEKSSKTAWDLN